LSRFLSMVVLKLVMAESVDHLALPPRLQKIFAAGVSKRFSIDQPFFQSMLPFAQNGTAENIKLQFRRTDSRFELSPLPSRDIPDFIVHLVNLLPQRRNEMIRLMEPQLVLPFQTLPHPQEYFERESECHER
jgi:hypothetical protein